MANYHDIRYDMALPTGASGAMVHIKTLTSDGSDDALSFVDGTDDVVLDGTYKTYIFKFTSIHPETDGVNFTFQGNVAGGSGYNETITSSSFNEWNDEAGTNAGVAYSASGDQAQGTGFNLLNSSSTIGNDNDQSLSGELWLFNPSNTTFVTHFISSTQWAGSTNFSIRSLHAGYFNLTGAIDEIQFKMSSGEIQAGSISMWGIA